MHERSELFFRHVRGTSRGEVIGPLLAPMGPSGREISNNCFDLADDVFTPISRIVGLDRGGTNQAVRQIVGVGEGRSGLYDP